MNVLFLMMSFPETREDYSLYADLAFEFQRNGHAVHVAALLEKRQGWTTRLDDVDGVQVLRVRSADFFNVGFLRKGVALLALQRSFWKAIKRHWPDKCFDLVIYPTPPISFLGVIQKLKRRTACKAYLVLRDIFPQNAVDVGLFGKGIIYAYFRRIEKRLYAVSDRIGCMSPANVRYLLAHNRLSADKVEILANWRKIREPRSAKAKDYRREYGLGDRFVAVFGGVIGVAQELEFLLEIATLYKECEDVAFLIVGSGNRKGKLEEAARASGLRNVVFKDMMTAADFSVLVRQCDLGLVNLDRRFTIPNFPSKVLDYFEAGKPVLAALDGVTDFGTMLEEAGAGLWSLTGDLPAYRANFEKLLANRSLREDMGLRGRRYLEAHLTVEGAYRTVVRHSPDLM
jgi:glycosyltransferase involved in cell wall biosynthesis